MLIEKRGDIIQDGRFVPQRLANGQKRASMIDAWIVDVFDKIT
jgi:hypothetical protein